MHVFIHIGPYVFPSYGLMILAGIFITNILLPCFAKKFHLNWNDCITLEAYAFIGAFLGAKILWLWVSRTTIDWRRITEISYVQLLLQSGFVFYGGLIGGLSFLFMGGKIHHIPVMNYLHKLIFLVPLGHAFGRIGCFLGGCCYGISYEGIFSVVFPEDSFAPSGMALFPVQMVEAFSLLLLSMILCFYAMRHEKGAWELYLVFYGLLRFIIEFFRGDNARGHFLFFSTSQWISILLVAGILLYARFKNKYTEKLERQRG